ncbi:MAG: DsbA family protein [Alphaproteobacteria bacterium GM202ARS2]|nr:DsbA family protein [Alphaproteobacteria bacterium GM202ARS2]
MKRPLTAITFSALFCLLLVPRTPAEAAIADTLEAMTEKVMGSTDAPVTLIEYASLTCGHCANFHNNVLPALKKRYIDSGKVKLVYRDYPLDIYALRAAMLARCSGDDKFFAFLKVLYQQQNNWARARDPLVELVHIANIGGIKGEDFKQCVGNKGLEDAILEERLRADKAYKITGTPTLIINEQKYTGAVTVEAISQALDAKLPK